MSSELRRTAGRWLAIAIAAACTPDGQRASYPPAGDAPAAITGFTAGETARQRDLERRLVSGVSAQQLGAFHRELTAEPHRATSPRNTALARWIADAWRAQGWDEVALVTYQAYFTEPEEVALDMVAPVGYRATLREDSYAVDPQSGRRGLPGAFSAFSASGDVTADVVYARGGEPEDYAALRSRGITVAGKIVIVRYAQPYSFRGFKVMTAERQGAAAIVLYSDPADDGAGRGPTFPDGPWGPDSHVQRGLTSYASIVPGDVTTPGWPSLPGARRLAPGDAGTLPRIPVLAISARDARPLLEHMTGEAVPPAWVGGLPITYRFSGDVRAHLRVRMTGALRSYVNVEARIRGSEDPDQWIVLGNHRDAWVYGGADPGTGTAALLELTRELGALRRAGWRPRRTVVVCSWDGEEEGLVGSTEWAEQHAAELQRDLVAYLNVDTAIFGARSLLPGAPGPSFEAAAVPSLAGMIVEASRDVPAPGGGSLYQAWRRTRALELGGVEPGDGDLAASAIDASSDHAVFLQHLARPVVSLTYAGQYGVYHSIYDDRYYVEHFGDPGFVYSTNIAQLWGVLATRLADAQIVPFDFVPYAELIGAGLTELAEAAGPAAGLDVTAATARVGQFRAAAERARRAAMRVLEAGQGDGPAAAALDRAARGVEGNWQSDRVVPAQPWSVHLIYGMRLTFHPQLLPGLTDSILRRDWPAARDQIARIRAALERNAALLDAAASAAIAR